MADLSNRALAAKLNPRPSPVSSRYLPGHMNIHADELSDPRIDGPAAWRVASVCLIIMSVTFGAPYVVTVALKQVAAEFGGQRSVPAAAMSLTWLGTGAGGVLMGWVAERAGVRWTVVGGASMVLLGLILSVGGTSWELYVGHGLFIGLVGNAALNAPIYVYVSRWFQRRRGTALALISSGQYIAGALWPPVFERTIELFGWRSTMVGFGTAAAGTIIPLALVYLKAAPPGHQPASLAGGNADLHGARPGLSPNVLFMSLLIASFLCCIPMAMPSAHLIAFCGDLGMLPVRGALALSMLLVCAFISRQFWGWVSDRNGGLPTLVVCSAVQAAATAGFVYTQSEAELFAVAAVFGLGFSGLIPAYILTVRELFPAEQAYWRVPMVFFFGMSGMAMGSWGAGLIYDYTGSYAPAFATGLTANLVNLTILLLLFTWRGRSHVRPALV